jgi:hypothetical protein
MNRKEYMENTSELHRAYYGQFVNRYILYVVRDYIGMDALMASEDPYLNDIPLQKWDRLSNSIPGHLSVPAEIDYPGQTQYAGKKFYSLSNGVCILKEAALQIIERGRE